MKQLTLTKASILLLAAILAGAFSLGSPARAQTPEPESELPEGAFVARVYYDQVSDLSRLARYDVWEYNNLAERYVLVSMDRAIYRELVRAGWRLGVDAEASGRLAAGLGPNTFYGGYRTVNELYAEMYGLAESHAGLVEVVDYGNSYCATVTCVTLGGDSQPGYDLLALRITNQAVIAVKPVFFLMANIHAREITTPELAMRMADWLLDGYGTDPDATWIVDHQETWIVPTANPDGHWLVELGTMPPYNGDPFYQRKNANRENGCNTWPPNSFSQYGVDLNRNFSFLWDTGGTSDLPCDQTYLGPSAASELEVSAIEALVASLIPDQRGPGMNDRAPLNTTGILITLHSYSELVLWPWGTTTDPAPNRTGLKAIGDKFATYNNYTSCQPSLCLYETSGTTDDWAYGVLGIPVYTFEVGNQFMPPYSEVDNIQWPENAPAFQYAAKIARTPYMLSGGPDALNVTATDNGDGTWTLAATINDSDNGGRNIRDAFYFADTPYWNNGTRVLMAASDGAFDSPVEAAEAIIDVSGWTSGRHIVFVHGRDVQRRVGPASAVFINIP